MALSVTIVAAAVVGLVGYGIAWMPLLCAGAFTAVAFGSVGFAIFIGYHSLSRANETARKAIEKPVDSPLPPK